jgi:tRNA (mo5U34)-methyltransferase
MNLSTADVSQFIVKSCNVNDGHKSDAVHWKIWHHVQGAHRAGKARSADRLRHPEIHQMESGVVLEDSRADHSTLLVHKDPEAPMHLEDIAKKVNSFRNRLAMAKHEASGVSWYPYNSLENFQQFNAGFKNAGRDLFLKISENKRILDIGAADGDTSFFLSDIGADVTIVDNPSTNFNDCTGIKYLQRSFDRRVKLIERDIDFSSEPFGEFDLAIFLGILYHLRNPMKALTALAESAEHMVVSTAIISRLKPGGVNIEDEDIAGLMSARRRNNDPTNYWYFTPHSMRLVLKRCGWDVLDEFRCGDVGQASPHGGDERMFTYCRRVPNWRDLRIHHDF